MDDAMKILKSLEEPSLLIKDVSEKIKNKSKKRNDGFLSMLLGTLDSSSLGHALTSREVKRSKVLDARAKIPR